MIPHQKGESAAPSEDAKNCMKERTMMGTAIRVCSIPRMLSRERQRLLSLSLKHIAPLSHEPTSTVFSSSVLLDYTCALEAGSDV